MIREDKIFMHVGVNGNRIVMSMRMRKGSKELVANESLGLLEMKSIQEESCL